MYIGRVPLKQLGLLCLVGGVAGGVGGGVAPITRGGGGIERPMAPSVAGKASPSAVAGTRVGVSGIGSMMAIELKGVEKTPGGENFDFESFLKTNSCTKIKSPLTKSKFHRSSLQPSKFQR